MSTKYGLFTEPSYITIGDPYNASREPKLSGSRLKGVNMKACKFSTGKQNDATFEHFKPLYEVEKYEKTWNERLQSLNGERKRFVTERPWKPSSPQKKSSGQGNYHGCIGRVFSHRPEIEHIVKKKGDVGHIPRNITTNPSKKGTYGTFGLTIGEKLGVTGAVGEYRYISTPYDEQRRLNAKENRERKSAQGESLKGQRSGTRSESPLRPFKPSSPPKTGRAGYPGLTLAPVPGIVGEYVYMELGVEQKKKKDYFPTPFRPSHPAKSGGHATLNKFPKYLEDPLDTKLKSQQEVKLQEIQRLQSKPRFFPTSSAKSDATPSILKMNVAMHA